MALGSTQPPTEMKECFLGVNAAGFSETSGIAYQNTLCHNQEIATHSYINSRKIKWAQWAG
jgi:hypothetical protein